MNLPILSENRSNSALRNKNYHYVLKTAGKLSAMFRFSISKCYALIFFHQIKKT